jgi:hypothetical protein
MGIVAGTRSGLFELGGRSWLDGREISGLAGADEGWWALVDGHELVRIADGDQRSIASIGGEVGRCLLPVGDAVLVGTSNARLMVVRDGSSEPSRPFDEAEGRDEWYTPWGGPPDTRSLSAGPDGALFANVHVGGILRAEDPAGTWTPTIDIDADVHQVLSDPHASRHVVAATALGLAESRDAGETWEFVTEGLHSSYARAVALEGDRLFMSASTGPRGGRAAVYRREPGASAFEPCRDGLPEWFDGNIDTHCLAAGNGSAAFGTSGGEVFESEDGGVSWRLVASDLPPVTCLSIAGQPIGPA